MMTGSCLTCVKTLVRSRMLPSNIPRSLLRYSPCCVVTGSDLKIQLVCCRELLMLLISSVSPGHLESIRKPKKNAASVKAANGFWIGFSSNSEGGIQLARQGAGCRMLHPSICLG